MTTEYRMLGKSERPQEGDEFFWKGHWTANSNWRNQIPVQMVGTPYRRPLPKRQVYVPQWKTQATPSCPVHVLWAESHPNTRTVAQVAAEAKPEATEAKPNPGAGYRLLDASEKVEVGDEWDWYSEEQPIWGKASGSIGKRAGDMGFMYRRRLPNVPGHGYMIVPQGGVIQEGDEWLQDDGSWKATKLPGGIYKHMDPISMLRRKLPWVTECPIAPPTGYYILGPDETWQAGDLIGSDDEWVTLHSFNFGTTTNTWNRTTSPRWCCRKLPVVAPEYRPYVDAAEAAAGLQGKLISNGVNGWRAVQRVNEDCVLVGNMVHTFAGLQKAWKFTDGTPCGVLVTNQGTK